LLNIEEYKKVFQIKKVIEKRSVPQYFRSFSDKITLDCNNLNPDVRSSWYYNETLLNGNVLSNGTLIIENPSEAPGSYICGKINEFGEMEILKHYEITGTEV
jgi:hypothetical protein